MEVQGQVEGPEPGDVSWGQAHPPGVHTFARGLWTHPTMRVTGAGGLSPGFRP